MSDLAKIEEIYHAALEKPLAEREAFLREACGKDENLRLEVESLLSFDEQAQNFIELPPADVASAVVSRNSNDNFVGSNFSHYRILSLLGAGGMGDVYLAEDTRLDRRVALKILPREFAANRERMTRFVREAKSASALSHPNIITIYEIGENEGTHFIAAEYIAGETLRARFKKQRLDLKTALDIAVQTASALDAAHSAGIVHRDTKPENIMVRPDGLVKILDFGIAKLSPAATGNLSYAVDRAAIASQSATNPGIIIGTANYMSPEQAKGKKIDARSDIFSFGIVLYEMLAGKQAFDGEVPLEIISSILKDEPAPIRSLISDFPPEIERIVSQTLRKNVDERYQTAGALLTDLKKIRLALEVSGTMSSGATQAQRENALTPALGAALKTDEPKSLTASAQIITGEIKKHKFSAAAASLIMLILLGSGLSYFFLGASNGHSAIDSIAVLPFQNASNDKNTEFLSDGLAETLINNFTKIPSLRVTARSTAFRYRGRDSEPQTVGSELGVRAILTGKVLHREDDLSVQVDLINAADGTQLWGNQYVGKASEILDIQQKIAREVSGLLKLELSGAEKQQVTKNYTESPEAYQSYLRGRYEWNKRTADGLKKAIQEFKAAADRDPNYALAMVGLADSYILLEEIAGTSSSETLPQAKAFATRALEIDGSLGEAHVSLGQINNHLRHWTEAERHFKRGIELNPNYPTAHFWYGTFLRDNGRLNESLAEIKRAQSLDPLSSIINVNVGIMHLVTNDPDSSVRQLERVIELDPNYWTARLFLGLVYLKQGQQEKALAELQKSVEMSNGSNRALATLGYALAVSGKRAEAFAIVKDLEEKYVNQRATLLNVATVYAGLGDKDQVFAWLEKNFETRSGEFARIRWYPQFETLRSDPRFNSLIERMKR